MKNHPWCKAAVILSLIVASLGNGCRRQFEPVELTGVPVVVPNPADLRIDVEALVYAATQEIHQELPEALLTGVVFKSDCQHLPQPQGILELMYVQVRRGLWARQVLVGLATVDTVQRSADYRTKDWSEHHIDIDEIDRESIRQVPAVLEMTRRVIQDKGISGCTATVTLLESGLWSIWLTEAGSGPLGRQLDAFDLDPETGETFEYSLAPTE